MKCQWKIFLFCSWFNQTPLFQNCYCCLKTWSQFSFSSGFSFLFLVRSLIQFFCCSTFFDWLVIMKCDNLSRKIQFLYKIRISPSNANLSFLAQTTNWFFRFSFFIEKKRKINDSWRNCSKRWNQWRRKRRKNNSKLVPRIQQIQRKISRKRRGVLWDERNELWIFWRRSQK